MNLWEHVREELSAGRDPVISVSYEMLKPLVVERAARAARTPERPYVLHGSAPFAGGKVRPRCMNPHCKRRLPSKKAYVCNDDCRVTALLYYRRAVVLLEKKPFRLPPKPKEVPDVVRFEGGRPVFPIPASPAIKPGKPRRAGNRTPGWLSGRSTDAVRAGLGRLLGEAQLRRQREGDQSNRSKSSSNQPRSRSD